MAVLGMGAIEAALEALGASIANLQRERAHPLMTLGELARGEEARLRGQLDTMALAPQALLELGARRADQLDRGGSSAAVALGMVAAVAGLEGLGLAQQLFTHEQRPVRLAGARGFSLASTFSASELRTRLLEARGPRETGAWLEVMGRRGVVVTELGGFLSSADGGIVTSALRCLRHPIPALASTLESLAEHPNPLLRARALRVALAWGTPRAFAICESQALDSSRLAPEAMVAYSLLGDANHRARLAESARPKERLPHVLQALGFSGDAGLIPAFLKGIEALEPLEAGLCAQAIIAITGLKLARSELFEGVRVAAAAARESGDAWPALVADAARAWWARGGRQLQLRGRLVLGALRTPAGVLGALETSPVGLRDGWALAAHLMSGGRFWLDVDALVSEQRAQLALALADTASWPRQPMAMQRGDREE